VSRTVSHQDRRQVQQIASAPKEDSGGHLIRAQEEERKRISRELHDETGQGLMLLRLQLGMLATVVQGEDAQQKVRQITELLDRTIGGLRRIIGRLSPRVLDELGLPAAIRKEARELEKNTGIKTHLHVPQRFGDLVSDVEITAYRCVQEALHNIAKHSQARNVTLQVRQPANQLILMIEDDGVGISSKGQARSRGFGLSGMRERIAGLGGSLQIDGGEMSGTRLKITLPVSTSRAREKQLPQRQHAVMKHTAVGRAS
jgi:signal transduction histidine kinase